MNRMGVNRSSRSFKVGCAMRCGSLEILGQAAGCVVGAQPIRGGGHGGLCFVILRRRVLPPC